MKRRLHFYIRDLFWLTLVVALAVGWWLEHRSWVAVDPLLVDTARPAMHVYALKNASASAILRTLQTSLAGNPNVLLTPDLRANTIIVNARPNQQKAIARLIDELDRPEG